jgi:hypothetical protein
MGNGGNAYPLPRAYLPASPCLPTRFPVPTYPLPRAYLVG